MIAKAVEVLRLHAKLKGARARYKKAEAKKHAELKRLMFREYTQP